MVHLCPEGWTFADYVAYCERQVEHERQRDEASHCTTIIKETWQLAMFAEPAELVQELIIEERKG